MPRLGPWPCVSTDTHGSPHADPPRPDETLGSLPTEAGGEPRADYDLRADRRARVARCSARTRPSSPPSLPRRRDRRRRSTRSPRGSTQGGRLIYVGAGSSGRLAALDAAECESTFSTAPGQVVALVAGGIASPPLVQEAAEDDADAGAADDRARSSVGADDAVVGVSASGRTPYVARRASRRHAARGALTAALVSVEGSELGRARRARDRRRRRPRVHRRLDAAQGRDGAEARPQHDLDDLDGPAREDVRQPHGRRRRDEREAARACPPDRRDGDRRVVRSSVDEALEAAGGNAKVAIVSLLAERRRGDGARTARRGGRQHPRLALDGHTGS